MSSQKNKSKTKTESSSSNLRLNPTVSRAKSENFNSKQIEYELKTRVFELEAEVKTLKHKLDELRKAKNTTLIKHEKEFVTTGFPQRQTGGNTNDSTSKTSHEDIEKLELKHKQLVEQLSSEIDDLKLANKSASSDTSAKCGHEEVIIALQGRLSEVESANTALSMQNEQLQEKLNQLYTEISQKEANHCEMQEAMKVELQKKWQEMYNEWMRTTEVKIAELQAANDMLRRMLGGPLTQS